MIKFYDTNLSYRLQIGIWKICIVFDWWYNPIAWRIFPLGMAFYFQRPTPRALDGVPPQETGDLTPADVHEKMARLAKPRRQ